MPEPRRATQPASRLRRPYLLSVIDEETGGQHTPDAEHVRAVAVHLHSMLTTARELDDSKANYEEYLNGLLTATVWLLEDLALDMTRALEAQGHSASDCVRVAQVFLATAQRHAELTLGGLVEAFGRWRPQTPARVKTPPVRAEEAPERTIAVEGGHGSD